MPSTATPRKMKILMLHGYAQSAAIFSKKMSTVRQACSAEYDFVFPDAPHVLAPADFTNRFEESSVRGRGTSEEAEPDPALVPRAWWNSLRVALTVGLEDSLLLVRDILSKDHYDAIFGFSQGAAMAALVVALLERPEIFPPFLVNGKPPHPPVAFCVSAAGFRPRSVLSDSIFLHGFSTPTLHMLGKTDVVVVEERAKTLFDLSHNKRIGWHEGGHFVPFRGNWPKFWKQHLKDPFGYVPFPTAQPTTPPLRGSIELECVDTQGDEKW